MTETSSPQPPVMRRVAQGFTRAIGLPVQFHAPGKFHVAEDESVPPFCRLMARGTKSCRHCMEAHLALQDPAGKETRTGVCFAGLTSSAVPVVSGNRVVGFLHTGHASLDQSPLCKEPRKNCRLPGRRRNSPCAGACRQTPVLSTSRYEGAIQLLGVLADKVADSPPVSLAPGAYPAVERAAELIRADVTRDWTLGQLARAVGMHPGYFSERFHAHMGITLTAFVSKLRVERAQHLLRFTALPVSEVAFACGFHSLSQFNRTFKKITGTTPRASRLENL